MGVCLLWRAMGYVNGTWWMRTARARNAATQGGSLTNYTLPRPMAITTRSRRKVMHPHL